jgi:hypothetical protein
MKLLYSETGFEQDYEPQVCFEGTTIELSNFIHEIKSHLSSYENNVVQMDLSIQTNDFEVELYIKENDTVLTKIDGNKLIISLDKKYWSEIINLIYPLTLKAGYQFVEFDNYSFFYNATILFSSVSPR